MGLVNHLSPRARLRLHPGDQDPWLHAAPATDAGYDVAQERSGWVTLLNGEHDP